jgi:hypothetical protein
MIYVPGLSEWSTDHRGVFEPGESSVVSVLCQSLLYVFPARGLPPPCSTYQVHITPVEILFVTDGPLDSLSHPQLLGTAPVARTESAGERATI